MVRVGSGEGKVWLAGYGGQAPGNAATDARRVSGGQAVKRAPLNSPGHPAGVESVKPRWERGNGGNAGFARSPGRDSPLTSNHRKLLLTPKVYVGEGNIIQILYTSLIIIGYWR